MPETMHPAAPHHLPAFITAPGETDVLLYVMVGFLLFVIVMLGVLYLRLHALPEHIAHRTGKVQLQIVAVLCLLALFTHNHLYWIAGLLLALIPLPDFSTPLAGMADSLARMADRRRGPPKIEVIQLQPAPEVEDVPPPARELKEVSHA
jgi:hypothetical protein